MRIAPLFCCVVTVALALSAGVASAATMSPGSEIGWIGTYAPTGGTGLADATGLSFDDGTVIIGSNDFAGQVGASVALADLSLTGPLPTGAWFTTAGGLSFAISNLSIELQSATALDFTATGVWSLAGFDDTAGFITWTGDELGGLFTSSGSGAVVVPVPAAAWLFGSALVGLGLIRRQS